MPLTSELVAAGAAAGDAGGVLELHAAIAVNNSTLITRAPIMNGRMLLTEIRC